MTATAVPPSATFETTLSSFGNNTGIVVPAEVVEALGSGKRPPVLVDLNGFQYRSTIAVMGGQHLVSVSAAVRKETGLAGGDPIRVVLTLAETPREVVVPADLQAAFDASPEAGRFFAGLSNSIQRFHIDTIEGAKTAETRARRVAKSVDLFLAGKKR